MKNICIIILFIVYIFNTSIKINEIGINGVLSGVVGPLIAGILTTKAHRTAAIFSFLIGVGSYLIIFTFFISNVMEAGALSSFAGTLAMFIANWIISYNSVRVTNKVTSL